MAITKKANAVIPEVFATIAVGEFTKASKMLKFAKVYNNLKGNPGDTINFPGYDTLTDADELTEGVALTTEVLSQHNTKATVKEVGKGVEITDSHIISSLGDPIGEAARQIGIVCANKVDSDLMAEFGTTSNVLDASSSTLSYEAIVDATALFGENMMDVQALFIHSKQLQALLKDPNFIDASKFGAPLMINGFKAIGMINGIPVIVSDKVKVVSGSPDTYESILFRANAVGLAYKRGMLIEQDRDILKRSTVVVGTLHYAVKLINEAHAVKLITK